MILHLETATKICSVGLSFQGNLVGIINKNDEDFIHGEALTELIAELLKIHATKLEALDAISVSIGPGSYTGLRIGLATAKGLCLGLNIPIIPISSLAALEFLAIKKHPNKTIISVFDARRDEVFCRIRDTNGNIHMEDAPLILENGTFSALNNPVCVGENLEKVNRLTAHPSLVIDEEVKCSALGQIVLAYHAYQNNRFANLATLVPNYTKEVFINQGIIPKEGKILK